MKRSFTVLAIATLSVFLTTGCEFNGSYEDGLKKTVIDDIYVNPDGWEVLNVGNPAQFDCVYCDIDMPEITTFILDYGFFHTYLIARDSGTQTLFQEGEGLVYYENGFEVSVNCEYSLGNMRITLRTSNQQPFYPTEPMYFRTVILY